MMQKQQQESKEEESKEIEVESNPLNTCDAYSYLAATVFPALHTALMHLEYNRPQNDACSQVALSLLQWNRDNQMRSKQQAVFFLYQQRIRAQLWEEHFKQQQNSENKK